MSQLSQDLTRVVRDHRDQRRRKESLVRKELNRLLKSFEKHRARLSATVEKLGEKMPGGKRRRKLTSLLSKIVPGVGRLERNHAELLESLRKWNDAETSAVRSMLRLLAGEDDTPSLREIQECETRRVLIDLRGWERGGVNGGLQVYVGWLIGQLTGRFRRRFVLLALTTPENLDDIAAMLGSEDAVLVEGNDQVIDGGESDGPAKAVTSMPLQALASVLGVGTVYAPFGTLPFTEGNFHFVALVADMLHAELPMCLPEATVKYRRALLKQTAECASLIQCISFSSEERLCFHFPKVKGKTFHTYLPVHSRLSEGNAETVSSDAEFGRYFFYPANLWPHKNHAGLLVGYQMYRTQAGAEPWSLVLCGSDFDGAADRLREAIAGMGLEQDIHRLGYVDDERLGRLWKNAGALVFPSLHEGFGIPLLEAMQKRVPILTSPAYSLHEIAGDAALYFNPNKPDQMARCMARISTEAGLAGHLIEKGTERLRHFDDRVEVELLAEALSGHLPQRPQGSFMAVCGCPR